MLNGKFYTGLPPKMIDRPGGNGCNRQESHFFWPDDTQVDSALESRGRRRASLQLDSSPKQHSRRLSPLREPEVDTRQMFRKEFAKSSIQFYDNLQPNESSCDSAVKRPLLRRGVRREVTPKLTALPGGEAVGGVDEAYTAAKRQQAYSSNIEFYDYINDVPQNNNSNNSNNNARLPKMDMNDKREVERNTKNSPKLQVKRNPRTLARELYTPEREMMPVISKKPLNDGKPIQLPKKILKQRSHEPDGGFPVDLVENGVRQLRLRPPPLPLPLPLPLPALPNYKLQMPVKKHVTYNEEADYAEYYDDDDIYRHRDRDRDRDRDVSDEFGVAGRTGNDKQQRRPYVETSRKSSGESFKNNNNKHNHNHGYSYSRGHNNYDTAATATAAATEITNMNTKANKASTRNMLKLAETKPVEKTTAIRTLTSTRDDTAAAPDTRKHLRSSLCFNGDALVVDAGAVSTATATAQQRAAMQRVSVGLPD